MSIPVFIVVAPKFPAFSESVILKAVDCVHLNCEDLSD